MTSKYTFTRDEIIDILTDHLAELELVSVEYQRPIAGATCHKDGSITLEVA